MRTVDTTLLFVLALSPLRAAEQAPTAPQACERLQTQALKLTGEKLLCEAGPAGLTLRDVSASGFQALKRDLFPDQRYLGYAIAPAPAPTARTAAGPSRIAAAKLALQMRAARSRIQNSPALAQAVVANFDNSVSRLGLDADADATAWGLATGGQAEFVSAQQGPPGSGGGGPPGSGGGPPGSGTPPRGGGPPGSGNPPGGQTPPGGGSTPPSRPAPVWRSNFPAPAPNWWNTDFNGYDWWDSLPSGYDRPREDRSNPDSFYYYSSWYRWRDVFVTNWERTEDSASISRTPANQDQIHTRSLTSQVYRESKECYYQAVYRYDWSQGGFYGSHWEERFDHYKARCIRQPREYGQPRVYTAHVSFDMNLVQGQDLPWDTDVIRLVYDGSGRPRYDFSGAAYRYSAQVNDQRAGSESVTLVAGAKVPRAPESDKVSAFLRVNAGKVEFVVNDDRASSYQGETLRVNARIVRRVVIKVKGLLWGWNEKNVDTVIHSSPVDILTAANHPQNVTDLTGAASTPKPANAVRSSVFIESWEFSRVNSRISTGAVIRQGRGNSISY